MPPQYGSLIEYDDGNILIANKPAGITTICSEYDNYSLTSMMRERYDPNLTPCQRLDRDTSGLLVFGRTKDAVKNINRMIMDRLVEKYYLAVVCSDIHEGVHGIVDAPLIYDPENNIAAVGRNGKQAHTEYYSLSNDGGISLLLLKLGTGRTHQIRVHMASIGAPVFGDDKYGGEQGERMYLHSCFLTFSYMEKHIEVMKLPEWGMPLDEKTLTGRIREFGVV